MSLYWFKLSSSFSFTLIKLNLLSCRFAKYSDVLGFYLPPFLSTEEYLFCTGILGCCVSFGVTLFDDAIA